MVILDTDNYTYCLVTLTTLVVKVTNVPMVIIGSFAGMLTQNHWFL